MQRYNDINTAVRVFVSNNDLFEHMNLNDLIFDELKEDFDFYSCILADRSDEEFNSAVDESIKNAYMTQSYSEKGRAPVESHGKYDIVVDVDGVLNDLHSALTLYLLEKGYKYQPQNVRTYDFNKNKPDSKEFDMGVPRSVLIESLSAVRIFQTAPLCWDAIFALKKCAYNGAKIVVYTLSPTDEISTFKHEFLKCLFFGYNNIDIHVETASDNEKPALFETRFVIDDCLENLTKYDRSVEKYLIDKPYNDQLYNTDYNQLFNDPHLYRYKSAADAITYIAERLSP